MMICPILFINLFVTYSGKRTSIFIHGTGFADVLLPHFTGIGCEHSHLFSIIRSDEIVDFDIVILHLNDHANFMEKYLRCNVTSNKIMILLSYESPYSVRRTLNLPLSQKYFTHWVFSYYKTSYFYVPYGYFKKKEHQETNQRIRLDERRKGIAGIISNCNMRKSVRLRYIRSLTEHIPVSLYGECYNHTITDVERDQILSKHKFFLAFENSHCEEYNTEKYWHSVVDGAIPIVMSYDKNLDHLIPGSYLDVFNFSNPKHLAQHLKDVMSCSQKEMFYHQWRKSYDAFIPKFSMDNCEMLETINQLLENNMGEDPTIHKLGNWSVCVDSVEVQQMIMSDP
ncbi:Alpha-(1,3)-fucosyltransferase 4 [Thelohanellus kitauei]|uniref:Fucosyltransferase n=1 Tax=Thelohanellus kitauei TaxID=669202 RepID=A0A0C2N026_THEKT|nr:Alpha-(1,3)-fucosyltransferase 4 [Thelohanellus kitauei]